jgi:hypothetical protein
METTRAVCTDWVLTFVKRGLSDDGSETPVDNRKLTWNPWSLCFITAGAGDWIDKDDDVVWTGKQTYTGEMVSTNKATYKWELITEKWVKYPHFDNVAALEAYAEPFGWMFAVVDSTWELYRYNAVTEERALIESSQPANPEMADDETIWTVRIATDAEFEAWTDTGSQWEYLVPTPSQVKSVSPDVDVNVFTLSSTSDLVTWQAILDSVLAWKCPIIKLNNEFYYLASISSTKIRFYSTNMATGTDSWHSSPNTYLWQYYTRIEYSGTTISAIYNWVWNKIYFSYSEE